MPAHNLPKAEADGESAGAEGKRKKGDHLGENHLGENHLVKKEENILVKENHQGEVEDK